MANKSPRRYRRDNVAVSLDLELFNQQLFAIFGLSPEKFSGGGQLSCVSGSSHTPCGPAVAYLLSEMYSKYDDGKSSSSKVDACMERFREAEELCSQTNQNMPLNFSGSITRRGIRSTVERARSRIEWLLGEFNWDTAVANVGFGPGATTRLPRRRADLAYKFSGIPHATLGCVGPAMAYLTMAPLWGSTLVDGIAEVTRGNRVTTVPKNYKTDRCIAIEPDWNMFFQKGIGAMIRDSLKRVGVNLDDQSRNRRMAAEGSRSGLLATIDLSMASDTVSRWIVRELLPLDWWAALEQVRSPQGVLPSGEVVTYQKFSSMGNGYTFELETLIFWGLARAVAEVYDCDWHSISVYGDDIIVPVAMCQPLLDVLEAVGFKPNAKKTHQEGYFRESCGGHYLHGEDISPFYVRRPVRKLSDLFLLHNNLWRWLAKPAVLSEVVEYSKIPELLLWLRSKAPERWRKPRIPDGFGDGAFVGTFSDCTPDKAPRGFEGWITKTLQFTRKAVDQDECLGVLLKSLWLMESIPKDVQYTALPEWERQWTCKRQLVRQWTRDDPHWVYLV